MTSENPFAPGKDVVSYDFHEEKSLKENLEVVGKDFCPALKVLFQDIEDSLQQKMKWYQKIAYYAIIKYLGFHVNFFNPAGLRGYIETVADICDMHSRKGFIFYTNLIYDLDARLGEAMPHAKLFGLKNSYKGLLRKACTSVLFIDHSRDSVVFGSNFDLPFIDLAKLSYHENYYKNNELIYTAVKLFGTDGAIRGYSHKGSFFVSLNQRNKRDPNDSFKKYFYELTFGTDLNPTQKVNTVLKSSHTLENAYDVIQKYGLTSPAYFTIGGVPTMESTSNGCVFERNLDSVNAKYCLNEQDWFIVQTNFDRDQMDPEPWPRRNAIEKKIKDLWYPNMKKENLYEFLQEEPNFAHGDPSIDSSWTLVTTIGETFYGNNASTFSSVWWDQSKNQKTSLNQ